MAAFIERLKVLALHCNFTNLDDPLTDQFVCGVIEHGTRVALLSEERLTLEKARKIAITRKSPIRNAARVDKTYSRAKSSIHYIAKKLVDSKSTNFQKKFNKYETAAK